jgi:hypothetical protein
MGKRYPDQPLRETTLALPAKVAGSSGLSEVTPPSTQKRSTTLAGPADLPAPTRTVALDWKRGDGWWNAAQMQ